MAQPLRVDTVDSSLAPVTTAGTGESAYHAYRILQFAFTVAPIVAGLDKFFHLLVNWDMYLSPIIPRVLHVSAHSFMMAVGVIEIVAGLLVAFKPRIFAWVVAAWLWGIIINLLTIPGFYDIALRDFGLSLGAAALAKLAQEYEGRRIVS
jgi:hypothetical protein